MAFSVSSPILRWRSMSLLFLRASLLLGATLTLPGIAGIVLTIGMAVDANVLIYETHPRGRHILGARSFPHSTLDSSGLLRRSSTPMSPCSSPPPSCIFGARGPCAGFAVSMALGILTSIVTAVTMTRIDDSAWYRYKRPAKLPI